MRSPRKDLQNSLKKKKGGGWGGEGEEHTIMELQWSYMDVRVGL